jgi:hypothetical protein
MEKGPLRHESGVASGRRAVKTGKRSGALGSIRRADCLRKPASASCREFAPPSMLVGGDNKILHLSEHVGRYLVSLEASRRIMR